MAARSASPRIAPFESREARIEIELDRAFTGIGQLEVNVSVSSEEACEPLCLEAILHVDQRRRSAERVDGGDGRNAHDSVDRGAAQMPTRSGRASR